MTDVTDATGATEHRDYDLAGRVTSVIDRSGHATTYAYDAAGQLTSVTDPTGRSRTTTYDPGTRRGGSPPSATGTAAAPSRSGTPQATASR